MPVYLPKETEAEALPSAAGGSDGGGYAPPALAASPAAAGDRNTDAAANGEADGGSGNGTAAPAPARTGEAAVAPPPSSGGLFDGLSMSPGAAPRGEDPETPKTPAAPKTLAAPKTPEAHPAGTAEPDGDGGDERAGKVSVEEEVAKIESRIDGGGDGGGDLEDDAGRSPTPVHSNAAPSPGGGPAAAGRPHDAPLVVRPAPPRPDAGGSGGSNPSGRGRAGAALRIPPGSPVRHPDTALRLLRKFRTRTAPSVPVHAGGSRPAGWFGWVFGGGAGSHPGDAEDLARYRELADALGEDSEGGDDGGAAGGSGSGDAADEDRIIVESILGRSGDTLPRARESLSAFVRLAAGWCESSAAGAAAVLEEGAAGPDPGAAVTPDLLASAIDAASALTAHGCLDDLSLQLGGGDGGDGDGPVLVKRAVNLLVESVCRADLPSSPRTELSALKFLLTAGCRVASPGDGAGEGGDAPSPGGPMLRGSHLLQAVRVCSTVCLNTESESNRTTARAALQQLVVTVFVRMDRAIDRAGVDAAVANAASGGEDGGGAKDGGGEGAPDTRKARRSDSDRQASFPSEDHRDAYLVLRSLCKLSMQARPVPAVAPVVMRAPPGTGGDRAASSAAPASAPPPPSTDGTADPAHESRVLALQLLLHILGHPVAGPSILRAGPQFHYAVRQYLCTSLLKNTTSADTAVAELSLRLFVPLLRHLRPILRVEIEAFVTGVFFVILDSRSATVRHKLLVVTLFEEVCSDAGTLAEIFLNYDCDLSAVDLFGRIVKELGRAARSGLSDAAGSGLPGGPGAGTGGTGLGLVAGAGAARAERSRQESRELRLAAMRAMRQVLRSLHSSIVTEAGAGDRGDISPDEAAARLGGDGGGDRPGGGGGDVPPDGDEKKQDDDDDRDAAAPRKTTLVEMYDSKRRRREEESRAALKFNQKPAAGLKYAASCGHVDADDPADVARYLHQNRDNFDKAQIGEYLGREKEWMGGFALRVLRSYGDLLDFRSMKFDEAIRYYLSGFRLPGEAQKIDRIMEVFAARYTDQNPDVFPTADSAFILAFSIIMLNTDLHNPAIKEDRKMTIASFQRMNSGVCDGGDFPDEMLEEIFHRIRDDQISLKEDDDARDAAGIKSGGDGAGPSALSSASDFFFGSHYVEQERAREINFQKEGDQIVRDTESMLRRRRRAGRGGGAPGGGGAGGGRRSGRDPLRSSSTARHFVGAADSGLRDEYVTPMFDVAWGPALAVFSTAIESANGTDGALASIATDGEMDHAVDNAAAAVDVSLDGFRLAIRVAGLCGNVTARDACVRALHNFTLLGSGHLLADRHVRCTQALLRLGRDDSEILGVTWEHIFRALTEVYRLHQVWEGMARTERRTAKARERAAARAAAAEAGGEDGSTGNDDGSDASSAYSDYNDVHLEEEMDKRMIDEANAMAVHSAVPLDVVDGIFQRSTALSRRSLNDFVYQLCRVSRMEISGYGGHVGSDANDIDLTNDHYMRHHTLSGDGAGDGGPGPGGGGAGVSASQPAIYSLEKLVEVTHFNMESRPRLIFADIWGTISTHLTSTALHEEAAVAMYAVDSLRQLSLQFLNREELGVFEFQRRFLKSLETIMSRSTHVSVKELLLSSVEQLISIYGFGDGGGGAGSPARKNHTGTLRSGWRSILVVLGTAGLDGDRTISDQGYGILDGQVRQCLLAAGADDGGGGRPDSLLTEHFVDLVNTLLLFVSGPHDDLSTKALESLVKLSDILAGGMVPLAASTRRKVPAVSLSPAKGGGGGVGGALQSPDLMQSDVLMLWWPLLLGLSQTLGDPRNEVRVKGLTTLLGIINKHFFPSAAGAGLNGPDGGGDGDDNGDAPSPQRGDLQTLQLIFRGILVPALEFEEMDGNSTSGCAPELLPPKFVHLATVPPSPEDGNASSTRRRQEWIGTTFEHLVDGCVALCIKSLGAFGSDPLVEECLAMLNSCLLSDSGHLAVRGLRRLLQFVTKDLNPEDVTDDTWATVCHMLFRVLSVRGLPPSSPPETEGATDEQREEMMRDHAESMDEFVREQRFFSNRRYIGCNAAMVIGSLLTNESIVNSMGVHWYIFLTNGLGKGIKDWERAAEIMDSSSSSLTSEPSPPHYLENVLYARRWMTKFLLSLMTQRDVSVLSSKPCQQVLRDESGAILQAFVSKEVNESSSIEMRNISKMVSDLLDCFSGLSDEKMATMPWLSPVLSTCIQTNNVTIRTSVQILLTRLLNGQKSHQGSSPG